MNRFSAFPPSQDLLRRLAALLAAASMPGFASAQSGPAPDAADDASAPATISAEQMSGRPDQELILERDVELIRGPTTVNADRATYRVVEDEVEAEGNVHIRRSGDTYTGEKLKYKMDAGEGYMLEPTYRLEANNAQGSADRIDFENQDRAVVAEGTYSTCEGTDPDWYLKASTLNLDKARDEGMAYSTFIYFKDVPVMAVPAMSFPLSDARKSGFLPPTIGTTNRGGLEVTVPYYLNIAPNRDLTLYPKMYARRGLQLGVDGRYLGETYSGQTKAEILLNDRQTGTRRYAISSVHTQALAPGLSYSWNLNSASDDDYPTDFANSLTTGSQRLLLRDMALGYSAGYWSAGARVSNYQVLQDPASPIARPYDRLPQLTFSARRQDVQGFDWEVGSELTNFWHPYMERGQRLVVNPKISYPIVNPGYFVTPKLSLHATTYELFDPATRMSRDLTRVVPIASVDSGLVFERDAQFFGQSMTQTLEPRLFYVRAPYRDQATYPVFDSAETDLSFAQLFSENRFVGSDRIGDANHLTAAVVTRYIEQDGAERMRFALGQRFHFEDQRVRLLAGRNDSRSDLLMSAYGRLTSTLSVDSNLQYSQSRHELSRANFGARWQPAPKKVLNLQYRRDRSNALKQVDVSGQWPLAQRWYGVARINYSLPDSKVAEGLLGIEYKADCWVFRVVAQRTPTATTEQNSAIFLQLELNGLTRLGSDPIEALRTNIPGYQMVN
jgi:LPS-assembly protein